jgi:hypothetical protein
MFNREYQIRAKRQARAKLRGEQTEILFPRRGRPSRVRRLEKAGQMRLGLHGKVQQTAATCAINVSEQTEPNACHAEDFEAALQMTFPVGPVGEDELEREFNRLFPLEC